MNFGIPLFITYSKRFFFNLLKISSKFHDTNKAFYQNERSIFLFGFATDSLQFNRRN